MTPTQTAAQKALTEARYYLRAALDWIDALPADVVSILPGMPGFDRDKAESALLYPPILYVEDERLCHICDAQIGPNTTVCPICGCDLKEDNGLHLDIEASNWSSIKEAAVRSKWIPPQYCTNDWVSDVCDFLRGGDTQGIYCAEAATHPGALLQNSSMGVRKVARDNPVLCAVDEDMHPETLYICRNMLAHTTQEDERPTVKYMRKDDTQDLEKMRRIVPEETYDYMAYCESDQSKIDEGWNACLDAIIEQQKL